VKRSTPDGRNEFRIQSSAAAPWSTLGLGTKLTLYGLLQTLKPKRHVAYNAVDKEGGGRSHSTLGPAVDVLLHALQVDVISHLRVVAPQIELCFFGIPSEAVYFQV
jgi:hypothetical protein